MTSSQALPAIISSVIRPFIPDPKTDSVSDILQEFVHLCKSHVGYLGDQIHVYDSVLNRHPAVPLIVREHFESIRHYLKLHTTLDVHIPRMFDLEDDMVLKQEIESFRSFLYNHQFSTCEQLMALNVGLTQSLAENLARKYYTKVHGDRYLTEVKDGGRVLRNRFQSDGQHVYVIDSSVMDSYSNVCFAQQDCMDTWYASRAVGMDGRKKPPVSIGVWLHMYPLVLTLVNESQFERIERNHKIYLRDEPVCTWKREISELEAEVESRRKEIYQLQCKIKRQEGAHR